MRRTGSNSPRHFCRHAAAGMVIAGATILGMIGGAQARALVQSGGTNRNGGDALAEPQTDELAFAVPRVGPGGRWGGVGLPEPLSPSDAARIRRIFEEQAAGDIASANLLMGAISDRSLVGDILADRYLRDGARPTSAQLSSWLKTYGDLPDAASIRTALHGMPASSAAGIPTASVGPATPGAGALGADPVAAPTPEEEDPAEASAPDADLTRLVRALAEAGHADQALRAVARARMTHVEGAVLRANIARILFGQGRDAEALSVGRDGSLRSEGRVGACAYVAGLAAWRLGRTAAAATLFETASRATLIAPSERAGAAFWAARAHLALGDASGYRPWMLRAAAAPRTFYGLLAARRLGLAGWTPAIDAVGEETLGEADVEAISARPFGRRVFALLQVGQTARAEATLRQAWPMIGNDLALARSVMLVAQAAGLTDLASQVAAILQQEDGRPRDAARFPTPPLRPAGGFEMDPALVYALTRLESNFDATAVSDAGAHGLMQLMPVTAGFISGHADRYVEAPARLHNAAVNLELGQRYVDYLAGSANVGGDLIRLLASYNAGPNRITDWDPVGARVEDGDPLLWMERIPNDETRGFVHRALTYLWIYAARLGLPDPSLDALAADIRPSYAPEIALAGEPVILH